MRNDKKWEKFGKDVKLAISSIKYWTERLNRLQDKCPHPEIKDGRCLQCLKKITTIN